MERKTNRLFLRGYFLGFRSAPGQESYLDRSSGTPEHTKRFYPQPRAAVLLPSCVRDLAAGQGDRTLDRVSEILLFGLEVCFATVRSPTETLPDGLLDLLDNDLRLKMLAQIVYVRRHAAADLEHL